MVYASINYPKDLEILIQKGSARNTFSFYFTSSAKKSNKLKSKQKEEASETKEATESKKVEVVGSVEEEILKVKKQISYPPDALEQGLESECEWKVKIGKNKKVETVEAIKPCKHRIFDKEFRKVIQNWEFNLPEGSELKIPVSFVIER